MEKQPYKEVNIEDLLTSEQFLNWVKHPNAELDKYWSQWVGDSADRRRKLEDAVLLLKSVEFKSLNGREDLVWNKIEKENYSSRYQKQEAVSPIKLIFSNRIINRVAAIAVILVLIGSLSVYFNYNKLFHTDPELITVVTKNGERKNVVLPDGTEIAMNSGSQLIYPSFFKKQRDIDLTGEAFFKVAKDKTKPFVVHSLGYTTQALGTSFNVKAYTGDNNITVALKTGKVVIDNENNTKWESVFLSPGEKLNIVNDNASKSKLDNDDLLWQEGVLVLSRTGFNEFVAIIERWYGVRVEVQGVPGEDWMVNGRFKNKSLAVVLESVSFAENIDYTVQGEQVKLSFK